MMQYISKIYKDSEESGSSTSESVKQGCIQEMKNGSIPVLLFWKQRHIKIFVSPDVSIQQIQSSVHQMTNLSTDTIKIASIFIYNEASGDYANGSLVKDTTIPIANLSKEKDIQLRLFFNDK